MACERGWVAGGWRGAPASTCRARRAPCRSRRTAAAPARQGPSGSGRGQPHGCGSPSFPHPAARLPVLSTHLGHVARVAAAPGWRELRGDRRRQRLGRPLLAQRRVHRLLQRVLEPLQHISTRHSGYSTTAEAEVAQPAPERWARVSSRAAEGARALAARTGAARACGAARAGNFGGDIRLHLGLTREILRCVSGSASRWSPALSRDSGLDTDRRRRR